MCVKVEEPNLLIEEFEGTGHELYVSLGYITLIYYDTSHIRE
jgi:hypothetical protein